jgi:hypothetical protein
VSDCGADPEVAFDDLGNAVRRVREDFGVEIELDLDPLRPNAQGLSRQHVAVGVVHYDQTSDVGILIYLKPTLTGDEPTDILQYRTRNQQFPHESTVDQFYDEAQWESYRRLGEHAARTVFRFLERAGEERKKSSLFQDARSEWYPTPPDLPARIEELASRFLEMERSIMDIAPRSLLREVFPESIEGRDEAALRYDTEENELFRTIQTLIRVIYVMEEVWDRCDLERYWNHPLNLGWLNAFQRWGTSRTFQAWWPFLKPMFGPGMRRFVEERLPSLRTVVDVVEEKDVKEHGGLAWKWWSTRVFPESEKARSLEVLKAARIYACRLEHPGPLLQKGKTVVGLAFVHEQTGSGGSHACWTPKEFFVPPSLWGAGIGGKFLARVIEALATATDPQTRAGKYRTCRVTLEGPRTDPASRQERADLLEFYKGHEFQADVEDANLLVLDLVKWREDHPDRIGGK